MSFAWAFIAFILVSCVDRPSDVGGNHPVNSELSYTGYYPDQVSTLDPFKTVDRYSQHIVIQIYDQLFQTYDGLDPKPHLVESFSYNQSKKTFNFRLRKGVRFHNDQALTADDVIFSFKRMCEKGRKKGRVVPLIKGCSSSGEPAIHKISDLEFTVELKEHFPPFVSMLGTYNFGVFPKDFSGMSEEDFFKKPIGTGPYKISKMDDQEIILERNENYFLGAPQISRLVYLIRPPADIYRLAEENQIDSIYPLPPPNKIPKGYEQVSLNRGATLFLGFQPKVKPFGIRAVRKAIQAALNTEEIFQQVKDVPGLMAAGGVVPWGALGFARDLPVNRFSPTMKKAFLLQAGFRSAAEVPPFHVYSIIKPPFAPVIPQKIVQQLNQQGFRAELKQVTIPEFLKAANSGLAGAFLLNLTKANIDTFPFLEEWSSEYHDGTLTIYDKKFDKILDEALLQPDRLARTRFYQAANQLLVEEAYTLPLFHTIRDISMRRMGWRFPAMGILGPYFVKMNEVKKLNE